MINVSFTANTFLGLIMIIAGIILVGLQYVEPLLSRDTDIVAGTLMFGYSFILIYEGWQLDSLLSYSQVLIVILLLAAGWENIRLRGLILQLNKTGQLSYLKLKKTKEFKRPKCK